jgi:hypothetical protein
MPFLIILGFFIQALTFIVLVLSSFTLLWQVHCSMAFVCDTPEDGTSYRNMKHITKLGVYSNAYVHDSCITIEITLTLIYKNRNWREGM